MQGLLMNQEMAIKKMESNLFIRWVKLLEQAVVQLSKALHYVGGTVLGLLVLFITADVIGRYGFNRSIKGDFELVVLAAGIVASFSLAYTLVENGHIRIDIATSRLPRAIRLGLDIMAYLFGLILSLLSTWRVILYGIGLKKSNLVSGMLPIPVYPFVFLVGFGCAVLCLVFFVKLIHFLMEAVDRWIR
jgi:TRAP-type C4-dicarboxylate transport system permease small subunit